MHSNTLVCPRSEQYEEEHNYEETMRSIFAMNEPTVMAASMGWVAAAMLQPRFRALWGQFPLFMLCGGRGSGKTRTASILGALHGCYSPLSLASGVTDSALLAICSSPPSGQRPELRVLDEYDTGALGSRRYEFLSEVFKAGFTGGSISKGGKDYVVACPLLITGEERIRQPGLAARTYQAELKESSIAGRQQNMGYLSAHPDSLREVGVELMLRASYVKDNWLEERMEYWAGRPVLKRYDSRQAYARQVLGCGLDFLRRALVEFLGLGLESELDRMYLAFSDSLDGHPNISLD